MSVEIQAYSVTLPRKNTTISVNNETRLFGGGMEVKFQLDALVGQRPISLVEREYDPRYIDNWKAFRAAGLPVVPTLRESSGGTLLVTDVKADGSEVYGKGMCLVLEGSGNDVARERVRPEVDKHFLAITHPDNFNKIEHSVAEYVDLANKNKIGLPEDDPFELLIHPDGRWELVILDLSLGYHSGSDTREYHIDEYEKNNKTSSTSFLEQLQVIRANLA